MSVWKRLSNVAWGTARVWGRRPTSDAREVDLDQELVERPPAQARSAAVPRQEDLRVSSVRTAPVEPVRRTDLFDVSATPDASPDVTGWLVAYLEQHGGVAGTVHHLTAGSGHLSLAAHHHIPDSVLEVTRMIPPGKGMAGLAWTRGVPVQTCDLQADTTGDVRPGARAVGAGAAAAIPVFDGTTLVAVVGIAFAAPGDLPPERLHALSRGAAGVPRAR